MQGFLKSIKGVLTYKEPVNNQAFELLEGESEGRDQHDKAGSSIIREEDEGQDKPRKRTQETNQYKVQWGEEKRTSVEDQCTGLSIVSLDLDVNIENINQEFNVPRNQDIVIRQFKIARKIRAAIVYVAGMIDKVTVNDIILRQLMSPEQFSDLLKEPVMDYIMDNVLSINEISKENKFENINLRILNGMTALFIEGCESSLLIETRGYEKRGIDKPSTETVIRGSQEAFTENLRTNLTLIRRIVKNKNLTTELMHIGDANNSNCAILYLEGVAAPKLINEVKRRIKNVKADFIIGDGMLEQYIEDSPFMLFPQVLTTERPDRAASFLMEGQVVIIVEGTPFANAVPVTFFHLLHTSEDSFLRWQYGSFLRIIRLVAFFVSAYIPGLYVALTLYRQEMIPTELLASIAQARELVPFPTIFEIIMMEISFELIREAGIRVPGVIGQTLGIIGALILGQAAVAANLVSPVLIIIVAVTGLGNFAIPNYSLGLGIRIVRFIFIFLGAICGFYGIAIGTFIISSIACSMKSFGVPFFAPVAPKTKSNPDLIIRKPSWMQEERPDYFNPPDRKREENTSRKWIYKRDGGKKDV